jgi:beta-phosphoglucomutase-like phosphatase (HAD superfamily)
MTSGQSPLEPLDAVVRQARHLLIAFDGPICTLFAGMPGAFAADQLRQTMTKEGVSLPQSVEIAADPLDILRFAASVGDGLASRVEAQLTQLESVAVASALPTPYITDVLAACRESGRSAAIVSANSSAAIHAYLAMHDLISQLKIGAARTGPDPLTLPLSPRLIAQAAAAVDAAPAVCAVISSTPDDIKAAQAAGAPSIGYAKTPDDAEHQVHAGATALVYSLADLALRIRARVGD